MLETITAEELVNTPLSSPGWVVEDLIGVGVTLLVGSPSPACACGSRQRRRSSLSA